MKRIKIATWNINSLRVRLPHVLQWLRSEQPDVLALQELKLPTEDFPLAAIAEAGYQAIVNGQKTYNGVALLYRQTVSDDTVMDFPGIALDPQRRMLASTIGGIRIINVYVPNGEAVTSDKYQYKLAWLKQLTHFLREELSQYPNLLILGDFNIAPEEIDVYDPAAWEGHVLFSPPERTALRNILALGLSDCFRAKNATTQAFSWWDYRLNAFKRNMGLRIDLMLASHHLSNRCLTCVIDQNPRGWERPSDHAPVIAEFST